MPQFVGILIVGLCAGILSGLVGIGGGIIIVPTLMFFYGFSQLKAQGTSLLMLLLPTGILAVWTYYRSGNIDIKVALLMAAGFVLGGWLGAKTAVVLPKDVLKRIFGLVLLLVSVKFILNK